MPTPAAKQEIGLRTQKGSVVAAISTRHAKKRAQRGASVPRLARSLNNTRNARCWFATYRGVAEVVTDCVVDVVPEAVGATASSEVIFFPVPGTLEDW